MRRLAAVMLCLLIPLQILCCAMPIFVTTAPKPDMSAGGAFSLGMAGASRLIFSRYQPLYRLPTGGRPFENYGLWLQALLASLLWMILCIGSGARTWLRRFVQHVLLPHSIHAPPQRYADRR